MTKGLNAELRDWGSKWVKEVASGLLIQIHYKGRNLHEITV